MKLYLLGGLDADADFFVVGVCESIDKAKALAEQQNAGDCDKWDTDRDEVYYFLSNATVVAILDCHHASYYIAELTLNEGLGGQ